MNYIALAIPEFHVDSSRSKVLDEIYIYLAQFSFFFVVFQVIIDRFDIVSIIAMC